MPQSEPFIPNRLHTWLYGPILLWLTLWPTVLVQAQELDARVTVNHQQVQGTSTSVFETLQTLSLIHISEPTSPY